MSDDAFDLTAEFHKPLPAVDARERKRADRRDATKRRERARQAHMRAKFGAGPDGQTCKTCVHLVHVTPGANTFLKCEVYGISRCESTDWRAKWPACGKFEVRA